MSTISAFLVWSIVYTLSFATPLPENASFFLFNSSISFALLWFFFGLNGFRGKALAFCELLLIALNYFAYSNFVSGGGVFYNQYEIILGTVNLTEFILFMVFLCGDSFSSNRNRDRDSDFSSNLYRSMGAIKK